MSNIMSQMQQQFIADLLFSNMNSRETIEDPDDQHVCRICNILGDEKLITSCRCSGSTKFAHTTCLVAWLENSITKRCESCGYHMCVDEKQSESASEQGIAAYCDRGVTEDGYKHAATKKLAEHYKSLQLRKIRHVKDEVHSLIYSVINCMFEHTDRHYSYNAKDIILKLKREIKKNYSMYNSLFKSDVDIYTQLQFYEDEVYCDTVTSEMLILSLCNYFNVEIVIVESYFGETFSGAAMIKQVVVPNCPTDESVPQRTLYLFRTSNHYQSLVPNGTTPLVIQPIPSEAFIDEKGFVQYCNREVKFCDQSKLKHHETQEKKQLPTHAASYYSCDHSKLKHHKTQEKEQLPTPGASSMKSPRNLLDYLGISAIPKHLETEEQKLSPTPSAPGMDLGEPNETPDTFSLKSFDDQEMTLLQP